MAQEIEIIEVNNQYKRKSKPRLIALEPRMLFDGAAVATIVDSAAQPDQTQQPALDQSVAPGVTSDDTSISSANEVSNASTDASYTPAVIGDVTTISQPSAADRKELVVVDGKLDDLQALLDDISRVDPTRTVLVLDPASDETSQLISYLNQLTAQYDAIHVVSHGGQGWVSLGDQILQLSTPEQNASFWSAIRTSLTSSGDVLLYGCNVASGTEGQAALDAVASITAADIAASTNVTGYSGDWVLESTNGSIETKTIAVTNWQDNLVDPIVVADITVNEASPYAAFTVDGGYGTSVKLSLVSGTATGGATNNGTNDFGTSMEYWNGSSWVTYTSGSTITIPVATDLLVRVALYRQTSYEGPESFTLQVLNSSNVLQDSAIATIKDDGTGSIFTGETTPTDDSAAYAAAVAAGASAAEKQAALDAWRTASFEKSRVIISSFHDALYKAEGGGYYASGENATAAGLATTTPILISPANGYNYTGSIIDVAVSSNGSGSGQYILLTTDGLYTWGDEGTSINASYTSSKNFQQINLPNLIPGDVQSISASYGGVMFLMKDGTVKSDASLSNFPPGHPAGLALASVVDAGGHAIQGITNLEYNTYAAFAYSESSQKFYTWGYSTYLGNGTAGTTRTTATEMINPLPQGVSVVQIGVSRSTYFVLGSDGRVYVMGENQSGVAGQASTTAVTSWTTMRDTTGVALTSLTNVQFISVSECENATSAFGAILRDSSVLVTGSNSSNMLGIVSPANVTIPTAPSGSIVGDKAYTIEIGGHFSSVLLYGCAGYVSASGHNPGGAFGDGSTASRTTYEETLFLGALDTACIVPVVLASPTLTQLADDRPLGVNDLTVNEGSPYAVFTVTGTVGKSISLALANSTASSADYGSSLEIFNGTAWVPYVAGSSVQIPSGGLLVRVAIINDSQAEGGETFTLTASSPGTTSAVGTGTIKDDGTGDVFSGTSGTPDVSPGTLDHDLNHAPAGTDKTITLNEDATYTISASDFGFTDPNDTPANTLQSVIIATLPGAGTLKLNGVAVTAGQTILAADIANLTYAPAANANGTNYASFTFKVVDNGGTANSGQNTDQSANTITFNVTPVNDTFADNNETVSTLEDTAVSGNVIDTGLTSGDGAITLTSFQVAGSATVYTAGQTATITGVGTITIGSNGAYTFTPVANYNGTVPVVTYSLSDDSGATVGDTSTLAITVTAVNDAPVAVDDSYTMLEDGTAITLTPLTGDTDVEGNTLSITSINGTTLTPGTAQTIAVTGGTVNVSAAGAITFTPTSNFNGTVTFPYVISDGAGGTATANEVITVTAVNDAPAGTDKTITLNEDATYTISASDFGFTDPNDTPANTLQSVIIATLPGAGTLKLNGVAVTAGQTILAADIANLTYAPAANANGTNYASFTFKVVDNGGTANSGQNTDQSANTITFNVTPVNDTFADNNETVSTLEDTAVSGNVIDTGLTSGDGAITLTSFQVAGSATVYTAGQTATITGVGTITIGSNGAYTFTPVANYNGTVPVVTYSLSDDSGATVGDTSTLAITVTAVNDAPVAVDDSYTMLEDGTAITLTPLTGDTDVEGNTLSITSINGTTLTPGTAQTIAVTGGTVNVSAAGAITFTPTSNFNGTVTFPYVISDGAGGTATANEVITVTAVNDAPAGTDKTITLNEDATYTISASDFGFTDPNDTPANTLQSVIIATLPGAGTLKLNGVAVTAGQTILAADIANLTYAPAANANGTNYASFTFKVVDNGGTANSGQNTDQSANTITFNVTAVNDPPVDGNETNTVTEDTTLTVATASGLLANTTDIDGGTATITAYTVDGVAGTPTIGSAFTIPNVGALTINANGSYTFVPVANYTGAIPVVTYTVSDGAGGTDTSTLTLSMVPVNDAPAGADKDVSVLDGGSHTFVVADFGFTDPLDVTANTLQSVIIATLPSIGTLKLNGVLVTAGQTILAADIGNLVYAPAANASGYNYANFTFKVVDNGGTANSGQNTDQSANVITINISGIRDDNETKSIAEDGMLLVDAATGLLANTSYIGTGTPAISAYSVNGVPGTPEIGSPFTIPNVGVLTINANGSYTFTPVANYNGTVPTITYSLSDDSGATVGDTSTLAITVTAVNDTFADNNETVSTPEDTPVSGNVIDTGLTSGDGTIALTSFQVAGSATVYTAGQTATITGVGTIVISSNGAYNFTPAANYNGTVPTITYSLSDDSGATVGDTSTLAITVTAVNDTFADNNETVSTLEDTAVSGNVIDTGLTSGDGAIILTSFQVAGSATVYTAGQTATITGVGTITIGSNGAYTFTPVANYNGTVPTITYSLSDGYGIAETSILSITVIPVDDAFTDNDEVVTTPEDTPVSGNVIDSGLISNDGVMTLTGFGVDTNNDGTAESFTAGQTATITGVGTIVIGSNGAYNFTPAANYNGTVPTITYSLSDDSGATVGDTSTLAITVTPVNDSPIDPNDVNAVTEDTTLNVAAGVGLLARAGDAENNALTITSYTIAGVIGTQAVGSAVTIPGVGALTINSDGSYSFVPAANYTGPIPIATYIVSDGAGGTDASTLTLTIVPVDDPFTDNDEVVTTPEDTPVSGNVIDSGLISNDGVMTLTGFGVDTNNDGTAESFTAGQTATITGVGTIVIGSNGAYNFTPAANYNGTVPTITYSLSDDSGATVGDTSTLAITVTAVNDSPVDGNEINDVQMDKVLLVSVAEGLLKNSDDVERSLLSITEFTVNGVLYPVTANAPGVADIAGIGKLIINSDGSYRYEPVAGYTGAIPVATYVISDGNGGFDASTLTLRVPSIVPPARNVGQTPFMPQLPLYQAIEMGKYEFHTVVLNFNGQYGGISQFGLPSIESTATRGDLQYSNQTPYVYFDRVGDEVRNAQRSIDAKLSLPSEADTGLRNPLLPPDVILDSAGKVSYIIPPATFVGGKGDIQLKVFTKDGKPVPDWIKFDPAKGKLDVALPVGVKEIVELQVVATDSKGDQAKTKLKIKPPEKPTQKSEFKGKPSLSSQIKSALMLRG